MVNAKSQQQNLLANLLRSRAVEFQTMVSLTILTKEMEDIYLSYN